MEILSKILNSSARVKIMRLFLLNPNEKYSKKEIIKKSRVNSNIASKEIKLLASTGFIKRFTTKWSFNPLFKYATEFNKLLISSDSLDKKNLINNFKKVGKVKFLLVSGIFIKNKDTRVDLLIVGNRMNKRKIEEEIRKLEAEIGTELVYAIFDTKEFLYRLNMYDKLVRDIIDFPHEVVFQTKDINLMKNTRNTS